jgi:hypothetical protein
MDFSFLVFGHGWGNILCACLPQAGLPAVAGLCANKYFKKL